jgi:hypothetical protein
MVCSFRTTCGIGCAGILLVLILITFKVKEKIRVELIKSSQAINCVNSKKKSNVSETFSVSIIWDRHESFKLHKNELSLWLVSLH